MIDKKQGTQSPHTPTPEKPLTGYPADRDALNQAYCVANGKRNANEIGDAFLKGVEWEKRRACNSHDALTAANAALVADAERYRMRRQMHLDDREYEHGYTRPEERAQWSADFDANTDKMIERAALKATQVKP